MDCEAGCNAVYTVHYTVQLCTQINDADPRTNAQGILGTAPTSTNLLHRLVYSWIGLVEEIIEDGEWIQRLKKSRISSMSSRPPPTMINDLKVWMVLVLTADEMLCIRRPIRASEDISLT